MFMSLTQRFITSTGQIEPAMIPVRSVERSWSPKEAWFCIAMNIVGTPYTPVHRSASIVRRVISGSNPGAGITIVAPWEVHPRFAITMPKQW
jgi:hypothetical protein